jgi:Carboxypeptidase regulatory-like domain
MKKVIILFLLFLSTLGFSQVTKSSISGTVKSAKGDLLPGAKIEVLHEPTGTKYFANADFTGSYAIPSIKPGGPYLVKISFMGMKMFTENEINAPLGSNVTVNAILKDELNALDEVVVVVKKPSSVFSKGRTGASQSFSNREITAVPTTGSRSISSITKYSSGSNNNGSFGGQDARLNNFTVDGSAFNDGFGLGQTAQAGGRTGSTAISLDAIEQVQINIAPFDVRQSGFTGTGINAVTKSGTNNVEGSVYGSTRTNKPGFVGTKAGKTEIVNQNFDEKTIGARIGLPIIKNKLFFFGNWEKIESTRPATPWTTSDSPNRGAQVSAPTTAQMQGLSTFLQDKFGYTTGAFENYDAQRYSQKFLGRVDWNVNDNNKLTLRYIHHDSNDDVGISGSNSVGFGNRSGNQNSLSYKNSGYVIFDNSRSIALELDTKINEKWSNNFIGGYDYQNEDRALQGGGIFPTIDILNGQQTVPGSGIFVNGVQTIPGSGVFTTGTTNFISAGLDPFTRDNRLSYSTLHITDNLTKRSGNHTYTFGVNLERYKSNNNFVAGTNGAFIFNSLDEFYIAANQSAVTGQPSNNALPIKTQFRYSALPGGAQPDQVLKSFKADVYAQDEIKIDNFKLTLGLRATRISFEDTGRENPFVSNLVFNQGKQFNTGKMLEPQYLFEPRIGFNLNVEGKSKTQVRGGTGIFTGRPPYVFISNAIGNNGVLTGFIDESANVGALGLGFTSTPDQFTPANPTVSNSNLELNFSNPNFKFPQVWKSSIALDQKLPFGFVGTIEGIFSKNINEVFYYNANLADAVGTINGSASGDNRPLYAGTPNGTRTNNSVSNGIVLSNSNQGYFYSTTLKLDYPASKGIFGSVSYTRSESQDLMSPGSTASASYSALRSVNGNNDVKLSNSNNYTPHRVIGLLGYKLDYGKKFGGSTSINLGYIGEQSGAFTYTYNGNLNGDGIVGNDLLYVPNKASDLRFVDITQNVGGGATQVIYTAAQQAEAFDKYIDQDSYLSGKRGQYVDRNSNVLPMLHKLDLSVTQDFYVMVKGHRNSIQLRADIINFGNLLNRSWGVSQRPTSAAILSLAPINGVPSSGNDFIPGYNLALQTNELGNRFLVKDTFVKQATIVDVWQAQFSLRYTFGK